MVTTFIHHVCVCVCVFVCVCVRARVCSEGAGWSVHITLAPGTYEFKFVLDDSLWVHDETKVCVCVCVPTIQPCEPRPPILPSLPHFRHRSLPPARPPACLPARLPSAADGERE